MSRMRPARSRAGISRSARFARQRARRGSSRPLPRVKRVGASMSLLMRRGAPLNAEGSTAFGPIFTAVTGHPPPDTINQACPDFAEHYRSFSENSTTRAPSSSM